MPDSNITLIGTLGRDPELRYTASGATVVGFSLAVTRKWKNRQTDEWEEQTSWVDVTAWGQLAENVAESLHKGNRAVVAGRIEEDQWEDKQTGGKRSKLKVVADAVGAELRFATAQVHRIERDQAQAKPKSAPAAHTYDSEEPF